MPLMILTCLLALLAVLEVIHCPQAHSLVFLPLSAAVRIEDLLHDAVAVGCGWLPPA